MIQERIEMLRPEYREFVLSDYAEKTARIFSRPLGFDEEETVAFENGIALFLLFFLSKDELAQFLIEEFDVLPGTAITVVDTICDGLPEGMVAGMQETFRRLNPDRAAGISTVRNTASDSTTAEQPQFIPTSVTYGPLGEERPQQKQPAEPAKQEVAAAEPAPEEPVQPLRTMEDDMDKIHGYGAYRKMYPDANGRTSSPAQEEVPEEEGVHRSTSQDEVLNKRPPLAGTPSYDQPPQQ